MYHGHSVILPLKRENKREFIFAFSIRQVDRKASELNEILHPQVQ